MITASQTKLIDAIVYDKRRSPLYYAKLSEAEKCRMIRDITNGYEVINLQLLGIKRINKKNEKPSRISVERNSIVSASNRQKLNKVTVLPKKNLTHPKRKQTPQKSQKSRFENSVESRTNACVCDETPVTTFPRQNINSQTYNKYSSNLLLEMNLWTGENSDNNSNLEFANPNDFRLKNDDRVHISQKFNEKCQSKWPVSNKSQLLVHTHCTRDGRDELQQFRPENANQTVHFANKKNWETNSSSAITCSCERGKENSNNLLNNTSNACCENGSCGGYSKSTNGSSSNSSNSRSMGMLVNCRGVVLDIPSVKDYINAYTVMSPRLNDKSTNTRENFHSLVKEKYALPKKFYASSSSPAFYTELSPKEESKERTLSKHLEESVRVPEKFTPEMDVKERQPCIGNGALPLEDLEHSNLIFGQDIEEDQINARKREKKMKEGCWKKFLKQLNCSEKSRS